MKIAYWKFDIWRQKIYFYSASEDVFLKEASEDVSDRFFPDKIWIQNGISIKNLKTN